MRWHDIIIEYKTGVYATAMWQVDTDGWLYRQRQPGEPQEKDIPPNDWVFIARGVLYARDSESAHMADAQQWEELLDRPLLEKKRKRRKPRAPIGIGYGYYWGGIGIGSGESSDGGGGDGGGGGGE